MIAIELTTPKVIFNGQELTIVKEPLLEDLLNQLPKEIEYSYSWTFHHPHKESTEHTRKEEGGLIIRGFKDYWEVGYGYEDYDGICYAFALGSIEGKDLKATIIEMLQHLENFPKQHKDFKWLVNEKERSLD